MHPSEIVDAAASGPVLVVGSIPPEGRDLDVLVDPATRDVLAATLEGAGFERHGDSWIRFAERSAYAVDLIPCGDWNVSDDELRAAMSIAETIPGFRQLVRPAPGHALVVLARKLSGERGSLRAKHARRIAEELDRDPRAWEEAAALAPRWGAAAALGQLRSRRERPATRIHRPRHGAVVAFSGLDGSGKSTQAAALAEALGRLGWETERVWVPLGSSESLQRLARVGKRVLRRHDDGQERLLWNPGGAAEDRGRAIETAAAVWSTAGTVANGIAHLRFAAAAAARGKVVVFDRYVLDTIVHLRFTYGGVPHPLQERLVRALSPRPVASYLLDLDPEAAHERKQDWDLNVLRAQAALYRSEHRGLGVRRLDAARPADELAAEIAREVWLRLKSA